MLGPEHAWPPRGGLGQGHAQKRERFGIPARLQHWKSPGSCSGGHLPLPTAPAPLGSVSCSSWECFPLLLGTAAGQTQHFLPQPSPSHSADLAPSSAQHQSRLEAPQLKCYKTQCQSPRDNHPALLLLLFTPFRAGPCSKAALLLVQLCSFSQRGGFSDPAWPCSIPLRKALDIWVGFFFLFKEASES